MTGRERWLREPLKGLGTRLSAGPESLERVPESLARMTEALWLRSLDEARERAKASLIGASPAQREVAALQGTVMALTAALAGSRARSIELEAQLLASVRDRIELREQVKQLAALLKAEQEMRGKRLGNTSPSTAPGQCMRSASAGFQMCGSRSSRRCSGVSGSRSSTSRRYA